MPVTRSYFRRAVPPHLQPTFWKIIAIRVQTESFDSSMYSHSLAVASAFMAGAMAQSTSVTSMFLYGFEGENIVASVISAAPDATSYYVNCAPGTDGSDVSRLP